LHVKDLELLKAINRFFKVGSVSLSGSSVARYRVKSREELKVIINHFNKYPLRSSKAISFAYFCEIFNLMGSKLHTNVSGFCFCLFVCASCFFVFCFLNWCL